MPNPYESPNAETSTHESLNSRLMPRWLMGVALGGTWYLTCLAWWSIARYAFQQSPPPPVLFTVLPVTLGGWLWVWGDEGPPYRCLESLWFNAIVGILVCSGTGVVLVYAATFRRRASTRNTHGGGEG